MVVLAGREELGGHTVLLENLADSGGGPGRHPALLIMKMQAVKVRLAGRDEPGG